MESRVSGLLMETGVSYSKLQLHRMGYLEQLLTTSDDIPDSIRPLLKMFRKHIDLEIAGTGPASSRPIAMLGRPLE